MKTHHNFLFGDFWVSVGWFEDNPFRLFSFTFLEKQEDYTVFFQINFLLFELSFGMEK